MNIAPLNFRPSKDPMKAIEELARKINELINAVNHKPQKSIEETSGKEGDIRIVDNQNDTTTVIVRTKNGWYKSNTLTKVENNG